MSNQNNQVDGSVLALVLFGLVVWIMFAIVFAIAAFLAAAFTVLAFFAWNKPLTLFGETMQPEEARRFVRNGLIGMAALPVFVIFCAALFKKQIPQQAWGYIVIGGYALGSIGVEYVIMQAEKEAAAKAASMPPESPVSLPTEAPRAQPQPQARPPFTFGDWSDEERPR